MNGSSIVFVHADDLWIVPRTGGVATRLLSGRATEGAVDTLVPDRRHSPRFSPDGGRVAFSAGSGGGDVYLLHLENGEVRRLTYHPRGDAVRGWAPDGQSILFASFREKSGNFWQLHRIAAEGGTPSRVPLDAAYDGALSADGRLVYQRYHTRDEWVSYRGGRVYDLEVVDLTRGEVIDAVPAEGAHVRSPFWYEGSIYYLSARDSVSADHDSFNLYRYDGAGGTPMRLTAFSFRGVTHAAAGAGGIVLVANGGLYVHDPGLDRTREVPLRFVDPGLELVETSTAPLAEWARNVSIAGTGEYLVAEVRGEVFAYDRRTDAATAITHTAGVGEREPAVSPDGQRVAYFSNASGVFRLVIAPFNGSGTMTEVDIDGSAAFYEDLDWSPDGRFLAFRGQALGLWVADVASGRVARVVVSEYPGQESYQTDWSPDSRYLAYSKADPAGVRSVFVYDLRSRRHHLVSGGTTHAESPVFDRSGRYLYFLDSDNARMAVARDIRFWGLLSSTLNQLLITRRLQLVVLSARGRSPLQAGTDQPQEGSFAPPDDDVVIDFEGIGHRTLTLPVEPRDYVELDAGPPGVIYLRALEWPPALLRSRSVPTPVYRYDLSQPDAVVEVVDDADEVHAAPGVDVLLFARRGSWWLRDPTAREDRVTFGGAVLEVDLQAEWRLMYDDVWRHARATYLTPDLDGVDVEGLQAHYAEYLPNLRSRQELNGLFDDMLTAHLRYVSHLSVSGGQSRPARSPDRSPGHPEKTAGLLGADIAVDGGCHRIERIHRGNRFSVRDPRVYAPLDQPGVGAREGECILAVNGTPLATERNILSYFLGLAGTPVELTLGTAPDGARRRITVVPVENDRPLREASWAADSARKVEERTGGRVGYVWLKSYGLDDIFSLMGDAIAQQGKDGLIIDHRFNGGGTTSDALIELLQRTPLYAYAYRHGGSIPVPPNPSPRAKVLIAHQHNASAAETFALMFKLAGIGPIVGTRTTGALVGASLSQPPLVDGGQVLIPNRATFAEGLSVDALEGVGVAPDIPVDHGPEATGRDPQLDRAIRVIMELLRSTRAEESHPPPSRSRDGAMH